MLPYQDCFSSRPGAPSFIIIPCSEVSVKIAAEQTKIAEGETASRGYARYDFHKYSMPYDFGLFNLTLFAGVENIRDKAYVNHMASNRGFIRNEPGRNVFVRVRG